MHLQNTANSITDQHFRNVTKKYIKKMYYERNTHYYKKYIEQCIMINNNIHIFREHVYLLNIMEFHFSTM